MKITPLIFCAFCSGALSAAAQQSPAPPVSQTTESDNPASPPPSPVPSPSATSAPARSAPIHPEQSATPAPSATAEPPVAKAQPVEEREIMVQLQIFLDQQLFGPGMIDGRGKLFTAQALDRYQRAHGLPVTGEIDAGIPLDSVYPVYATYEIQPEDLKFVGDLPSKPSEQAKKKYMPYPSLHIFVAERYHSDPDFLVKLNPGLNLEKLKPGDKVRVPNVAPFKIEELSEIGKLPVKPEFQSRVMIVDTKAKELELMEGEKFLASVPITPGSSKLPAPKGAWRVVGIAEMPWFRHDDSVLNYGVRSGNFFNIPAGPRNPVGVMWMGLNKPGIGIHGTNSPFTIGRSGSHGCIRVANWDVVRLSSMVTEGMKVIIK